MVLCTTKRFAIRSKLPNCVPFRTGEFGMPSDCVAQCEAIYALEKGEIDIASGTMGRLDATRLKSSSATISDQAPGLWDREPQSVTDGG
jgi:mRNA-degrading endonuclease toxin of MazEF toxin-antitoxin module